MASLGAHLRQAGDHGRLRFHPACPVCCESRLCGALPADVIVSRRAQALVTASVLAFSSAAPASVLAAGDDQETVETPSPAAGSDPSDDANFHPADEDQTADDDTEGDSAVGPDAEEFGPDPIVDPAVSEGAPDPTQGAGNGSISPAPTKNTAEPGRNAKPNADAAKPVAEEAPVPASSQPESAPAPTAPAAAGPGVVAPTALATAPGAVGEQRGRLAANLRTRASADARAALAHSRSHAVVVRAAPKPAAPVRHSDSSVPVAVTSAPTYVVRRVVARPVVAAPEGRRAVPGDRVHVVAAGESLWSIANDVLGGRATVAQVAREVNRLWELNGARIGTGNRDLLPIGARLELK
jgi:hypothetical protein